MERIRRVGIIVSLFISIILFSCDPTYSVDYVIENQTNGNISLLISKISKEKSDSNQISSGTKLVIYSAFNIGQSTKGYLNKLESLPFYEISILKNDTIQCTKDVLDITNWDKIYPQYNGANGIIQLAIFEEDFK